MFQGRWGIFPAAEIFQTPGEYSRSREYSRLLGNIPGRGNIPDSWGIFPAAVLIVSVSMRTLRWSFILFNPVRKVLPAPVVDGRQQKCIVCIP